MALRHHRGLWQRSCAALALLGFISGQILSAQAKAQTPVSANILAEAAKAIGVKKCQNALSRLGAVTAYGSQKQEVLMDWNRQNPDTNPVFSLLGADYPNGAIAVSVVAVPDASGSGCSVSAERISVAPFTCESIAKTELANYPVTTLLPRFKVYTDPTDSSSTVSLLDSPPGCLMIRRYVKFHWLPPKS